MSKPGEYYLGLDLGTGSVGWCVTDTEYRIPKVNRRRTIGTVLFSTAETAKERRVIRCARRRLRRQRERLDCLQEMFGEEIAKIDAGFFHRLLESPYIPEDKENLDGSRPELPYALFVDKDFSDVQYHVKYPTIYHLRKELMDDPSPHDLRLVYLAVAHILKHRGHFLSSFDVNENGRSFEEILDDFIKVWNEYTEKNIELSSDSRVILKEILLDSSRLKSQKKTEIIRILGGRNPQFKELAALFVGASTSLEKLFCKEEYKNLEENKIQFDAADYEEKEGYYRESLGDDFEVIELVFAPDFFSYL